MNRTRYTSLAFPAEERARVFEASRRRALLDGGWGRMLQEHVQGQLGPVRAKIVGEVDTGSNLFSAAVEEASGLYVETPRFRIRSESLRTRWEEATEDYWLIASQNQEYAKGLQQSLVYIGWDDYLEQPSYELATADTVQIEVSPQNKMRAVRIWWGRERQVPGKRDLAWFWDYYDISDPDNPTFQILSNDRRRDLSHEFMEDPGRWRGKSYPLRSEDNDRPLLPFALYHGNGPGGGAPWSPYKKSEVVFGTLQVGLLWTAAVHGVLRASWDQRVILNGRIRGGRVTSGEGSLDGEDGFPRMRSITPDPTRVLQFEGDNAKIASWGASIDIEKAERFCRMYEARLAQHFKLPPSAVVVDALNPESGASLSIKEGAKSRIVRRDRKFFGRGDHELMVVVSAQTRAHGGDDLPTREGGKKIGLRYSVGELVGDERVKAETASKMAIENGTLDQIGAYILTHPGVSETDAFDDLVRQAERSAELEAKRMDADDGLEKRRAVMAELSLVRTEEEDEDGEESEEEEGEPGQGLQESTQG